MRSIFLLFFVVTCSISIVHGEQCKQGYAKDKADMLADDWLGLKCDPLDEKSLSDNNLKSPCECLKKGEKWGRIKEAIFKHNRDKRSDSIQALLEKKVADVIRSQIDNGFDQSLRMDTLLKQGGVDIYAEGTKNSFPKNCRASKIGEVIAEALKKGECSKEVYDKRLKAFLGDSQNIDEYLEKRKTVYSNAAMNTLSSNDRARGMCIPYKTFQSLNNQNPLRKTYLSLARAYSIPSSCPKNVSNCDQYIKDESFKAFKKFQDWASSRKDGYNSLYIPNQSVAGSARSERPGLLRRITEEANQTMDTKSGIESIDREGVLHLIKTDPVFERMIKDPEFYLKVSTGAFGGPDNFRESDPELVNSMMRSQDKQCQKLYGTSASTKDIPSASDSASQRTGVNKAVNKINNTSEKNILTQFLCNEDFPKKFISKDSIRNILAPELKREANINGIKHTEAIVAKWAYCSEDDVREGKDGSFEIVFGGEEKGTDGEIQPLSKFLNLSLNPKSDLESSESSADNEYEKFNNEICKSVDDKCKNPNPSYVDYDCSTSNIAKDVTLKMLSSTFGAERAAELNKKFNDPNVSDKELRQEMIGQRTLGEDKTLVDKATTLILLRNQSVQAKSMRATAELKAALGIPGEKNIDDYFKEHGGRDAVLGKVPPNIKERFEDAKNGYRQDNISREAFDDRRSSYFTNYYVLADSKAELSATEGIKNNSNPNSGTGIGGGTFPGASGPISTRGEGDNGTINNGQVATGNSPIYQRRSFESSDTTPVTPPGNGTITPTPPKTPLPPPKRDITDTKTPEAPKVVPDKAPKAKEALANIDTQRPAPGNTSNSNFGFTLSQGRDGSSGNDGGGSSSGNDGGSEKSAEWARLEKLKKELQDKLAKQEKELKDLQNGNGESGEPSEFDKEKKRLTDEINRLEKNKNSNHSSNNNFGNNNRNNNDTTWNNNNGNDTPWNNNNSFNNGYGRGEEFDKEKAMKKLDDGSAAFDPEKASKEKMANDQAEGKGEKGGGSAGGGSKGKGAGGKGASGGVSLSELGGGESDGEDGSSSGASGRNKKRRAGGESDVVAKCSTDPILKCIFPNSYFVDTKIKDRLYTTIYNLKLEGRQFQGLEKVRRSKRVTKTQYYLYTYDLVAKEKGKLRQANNDERAMIFNEIKQNRSNPAFKKQLEIYRHMTTVVPPKILLGDKEAIDAVNRSITKEEYEALQQ